MDDVIRPSQAAKRRSLHKEGRLRQEHSDDDDSEDSASDVGDMIGNGDDDTDIDSEPSARGKKRKRSRSQTPEPTRRSSRRRTKPKVSYNMKVHPQDSDLNRIWACDGSKSSPSSARPTGNRELARDAEQCLVKDSDDATQSFRGHEPEGKPRTCDAYAC